MPARKDWSSIVVPKGPNGEIVGISKDGDSYVQFPGGKRNRKDRTPEHTARRETLEEIGVRISIKSLRLLGTWEQHNYKTHLPFQMYLFECLLTKEQLDSHFSLSRERETVGVYTWADLNKLYQSRRFSPYHQKKAAEYGVWRKT